MKKVNKKKCKDTQEDWKNLADEFRLKIREYLLSSMKQDKDPSDILAQINKAIAWTMGQHMAMGEDQEERDMFYAMLIKQSKHALNLHLDLLKRIAKNDPELSMFADD